LLFHVEHSKIKKIGQVANLHINPLLKTVDLVGATILPGVIDCQAHLAIEGGLNPTAQIARDSAEIPDLRIRWNALKTPRA
jgi:imidazolonepropionase-like amidohydrolase